MERRLALASDPESAIGSLLYFRPMQGVVQVYDPVTEVGVIVRDDNREQVYLRPGSLSGSIFLMLRQGQRVVFDLESEEGVDYAARLRFGSDGY